MSHEYSEGKLVRDSAYHFLKEKLGWRGYYAYNVETFGPSSPLGRNNKEDVLLYRLFRESLKRLNPWMNKKQIDEAQEKMVAVSASDTLLATNEKKYAFLRDGVPVTVEREDGSSSTKHALLIDFDHPEANDFLAVEEMWVKGELYTRRTDMLGFINGMPLLFFEFKNTGVEVENAYTENYRDYQATVPQLFFYNAFSILSNGEEARVGTLGSSYKFFAEWKHLKENDPSQVDLERMLRGLCDKKNLLDILENFILFDRSSGSLVKILAYNHQYLGVNEAIEAYRNRKLRDGKLGVFWHTQGSGKSYSMVFMARKIRRKFGGSPTILLLTDREELNEQLANTFAGCGLLSESEMKRSMPRNGEALYAMLTENPAFIFSLIQKFNRPAAPIYPDHDILIMSDEAHRSQNGIFAERMLALLPTASRIGFTGTPLLSHDELTARTFGGYVSIYDFQQALEDGATVPLFYENRGEKILHLKNPEITDEILQAVEETAEEEDETQQTALYQYFKKEMHLLMAKPRLVSIAKDFVNHYSDRWNSGKAMFVALNRVTCLMMYNLVQQFWEEKIQELEKEIQASSHQQEAILLQEKLTWMKETEMHVVISSSQNEVSYFEKWGLDITPHRKYMNDYGEEMKKHFKSRYHPFRVVFVCAMWLTGFDVKSLTYLYMDKLMKAHSLMQAIARANRVDEGKENGLIVDYVGILESLNKALAQYANREENGGTLVADVSELLAKVRGLIHGEEKILADRGFALDSLFQMKDFALIRGLRDAANAVCMPDVVRKTFVQQAGQLKRLSYYLDREQLTKEEQHKKNAIIKIAESLRPKKKDRDRTDILVKIHHIMNDHVEMEKAKDDGTPNGVIDLSRIDFARLGEAFSRRRHKALLLEAMKTQIADTLDEMIRVNGHRINYYERFQQIIDHYNEEKDESRLQQEFEELLRLTKEMNEEQKRYTKEGFDSDEELAIYELLISDKKLTPYELKKVKQAARHVTEKVKEKITELDHWKEKEQTQATVKVFIRNELAREIPATYGYQGLKDCNERIFQYFYENRD